MQWWPFNRGSAVEPAEPAADEAVGEIADTATTAAEAGAPTLSPGLYTATLIWSVLFLFARVLGVHGTLCILQYVYARWVDPVVNYVTTYGFEYIPEKVRAIEWPRYRTEIELSWLVSFLYSWLFFLSFL